MPKLFFALAFLTASAAAQAPTLAIQLDKPVHAVSPTLYGLMTEEINYSYDGGLYAELIRNRTFQEHGFGGVAHWNVEHMGDSSSTMEIDSQTGPSAALQSSLRVTLQGNTAAAPAGVRNEGYWGIPLHASTSYKGFLYAKADSAALGPVTVSLVSDNSGDTLASATLPALTGAWARYDFTLTTDAKLKAGAENHFLLTAPNPGKLWISMVSLMPPTYSNRANGNRPDLMGMMAQMHPTFLRLPGGNYLEGDQIDERFDWKQTIGPEVDRPTHRSPWGYQSSDGLGLLEFLEWSEDLHIDTVLAVYAGYSLKGDHIHPGPTLVPFVDDALDEIEFATGDTSTKWGARRAALGHAAPFAIKYIEIGNEDWFDKSGSYEARFNQFNSAIKARFGSRFQTIATAPLKHTRPDVLDDHYYKRADEFFEDVHHYDTGDRNGPKIFVGEWATREGSPTTNLGAALGDAAWMTGMERNSDLIVMASYAPLFVNVDPGGMQWESNLIGYDAMSAYGAPSFYAQSLFAQYLGTEVPASTLTGAGSRLFYSITRSPAKGEAYLKLVNATSVPQPLAITLSGATVAKSATVETLTGHTLAETNTLSTPTRIVPVKSTLKTGASFTHTIPPYSIQVIELKTSN
jgi:alpha-N-arabinofuranosidase